MYSRDVDRGMSTTESGHPIADDRLRRLVAVLDAATETTLPFDTLVNRVLRREYQGSRDPTEHRRSVANALHFDVLPRLADGDALTYDPDRGTVTADADRLAAIRASAESGLGPDAAPAAPRPPSPREASASAVDRRS
jgi:hypothetical protein